MKTKSLFVALALAAVPMAANAGTYALFPDAQAGETQIPYEWNGWYNVAIAVGADGEANAWKVSMENNALTDASGGWLSLATHKFDFKALADKDLVFEAKVQGPGAWLLRLTTPDNDQAITIPADGQYHKIRYSIKDDFPGVYATWNAWNNEGEGNPNIFPFATVGTGLGAESAIYVTNIRFVDHIDMPAIEADVNNVTANSADIVYSVNFPEGYTDTSVTINGEAAENAATLNLSGLDAKTEYTYTILASGSIAGETYVTEKVVKFKTLRQEGDNPIWHGTSETNGFSAVYSITYNPDKTITVEAEFESEKAINPNDCNFHMFNGPAGMEWLKLKPQDDGLWKATTTATFEEGFTINWEWYHPVEGGLYQVAGKYVVGSENEPIAALRLKSAKAGNITSSSAEITYTVAGADEYQIYYKASDADGYTLATANPIVLEGLNENTEYTYELYAAATVGGESLTSNVVPVTFKTSREGAVALVYSDLYAAEFKNAFVAGQDESQRHSIFANLAWTVTYRADGTAVYTVDLSEVEDIVGLNPQIYWNGFQQLTKNAEGLYEYDFGAQTVDGEVAISHYFAYNGGVVDVRTPYVAWGMEKTAPEVGPAASIEVTVSKTYARVFETVGLNAFAKDAQGYYLSVDDVEFVATTEGDAKLPEIDGNEATMQAKGIFSFTAKSGDTQSAAVRVLVYAHDQSENLIEGNSVGQTCEEHIQAGGVHLVTDGDEMSQLEWKCGETEEHYLIYKLSQPYYVETVELIFEGAYATEYSVTLGNAAPAEYLDTNGLSLYADEEVAPDKVLTHADAMDLGEGTRRYLPNDQLDKTYQYVTLRTHKALNTDWGIKLREMRVYGSDDQNKVVTGIENIISDETNNDAPAEYYNLNGVRVANPTAGIYIERRGNKVSKVIVK